MAPHVCPWWLGYAIDTRLRKCIHEPETILAEQVREGMTVLDVGCGMGFFSVAMAKRTGESGRVITADIQGRFLRKTMTRAAREGVSGRLSPLVCRSGAFDIPRRVDFALCFRVLHATPNPPDLLGGIAQCLRPGAGLFLVAPRVRVSRKEFLSLVATARLQGLSLSGEPPVRFSDAALFLHE